MESIEDTMELLPNGPEAHADGRAAAGVAAQTGGPEAPEVATVGQHVDAL